ncbi:hypothetical protein V1512DRAFT_226176 [Lipomyces arxii]|uniref:uncharacterized protein n=1 Tax=Lipomyces arxii TaxID=56418 RepID=UPI0034CFE755
MASRILFKRVHRLTQSARCRIQARSLQTVQSGEDDFKGRLKSMLASDVEMYPVILRSDTYARISEIRHKYDTVSAEQLAAQDSIVTTIRGRIHTIRAQGNRLLFIDVVQEDVKLQAVYRLNSIDGMNEQTFRESCQWLRRGDFISITGTLTRTRAGELSVRATTKLTLLAPCLHPIPFNLSNEQTLSHHRTVDLLIHKHARDTIRARAFVLNHIRAFLTSRDFLEVHTPVLSDVAGGAAARPFITHATAPGASASSAVPLELRIAPELWLKRLIISGFDKVFEIGQVFRNEGIDATHNPEFTTCEFYQAFAGLDDLIDLTEELLSGLVQTAIANVPIIKQNLESNALSFDKPFVKIDFISTLQQKLGFDLPDYVLSSNEHDKVRAESYLTDLLTSSNIPLPKPATVSRLLDKLCDHFIGPILDSATTPVFLMNFPEILSPLSKSAPPASGRSYRLARRFELYVNGKELVNAYEEENSPFAQRRKFSLQAADRVADAEIYATDDGYLSSMEWGLPPTGGWGIGIDRLVMLLTGAERISDVLSFGGIKGVIKQE